MIGKTIEELQVGERAEFSKTISETDVYLYAGITGDLNPAHVDEEYAKKTFFKTRIAHGMLLGGLISGVLGNRLPGPGTIYLRQEMDFLGPGSLWGHPHCGRGDFRNRQGAEASQGQDHLCESGGNTCSHRGGGRKSA
jgi:hypothetical protein